MQTIAQLCKNQSHIVIMVRIVTLIVMQCMSIQIGLGINSTRTVVENELQRPLLSQKAFVVQRPVMDTLVNTSDTFWRDLTIGGLSIGIGQLLGIWVSSSDLRTPIPSPSGTIAVILFVLATVLLFGGIIWLIRAITRKIKSNRRAKKRKKAKA